MYLTFAWRYFKAKKNATAINIISWVTVGVIAFATACQILVLSVFNGFEDLVKSLYASFYTDLKVVPTTGKTFTLTQDQIQLIKKQPNIIALSLIVEEKSLLKNGDAQTIINLKGVDNNYANVSGVAAKTIQGKFDIGTINNPGLVVGYGIQNAAEISVEGALAASKLTLILPKKSSTPITDPLQSLSEGNAIATGVFAIQQDFDSKYVITNIDFVKQQLGYATNEFSAVEIKLNPSADFKIAQKNLSNVLGKQFWVQTKYEQNMSLYSTLKLEKWFVYAVLMLILIIAAFNMISALTMLVLEKQKDISVLQSMGANKQLIYKIFLGEGLLLGNIGAIIGIIVALLICVLQIKFKLMKLTGNSFLIDYFPVSLQITDFIIVSISVLFIAFIAAWLPARKAAKQAIELR